MLFLDHVCVIFRSLTAAQFLESGIQSRLKWPVKVKLDEPERSSAV